MIMLIFLVFLNRRIAEIQQCQEEDFKKGFVVTKMPLSVNYLLVLKKEILSNQMF